MRLPLPLRKPLKLWRRSLLFRSVAGASFLTLLAVSGIFGFMSSSIANQLFDTKLEQVLGASNRAAAQAQASLTSSAATDAASIQGLKTSIITGTVTLTSSGAVGLIRSPSSIETGQSQDVSSSALDMQDISEQMRAAVQQEPGSLFWQSITLAESDSPGIITGITLNVPVAGQHELYVVYDLAGENATLGFVQRVLLIGGLVLVLVVAISTLLVVGYVLKPVTEAARTSRQLAGGDLAQRIPVQGEDEMTTLASSFNQMADAMQHQITQLGNLSTMQQRFVSDVSHELRTPLTTIRLAGDMIYAERENLPVTTKRASELLHAQVGRFEELLADLLEVSRFDAGAARLEPVRFDLRELMMNTAQDLGNVAQQMGTDIRFGGKNDRVWVTADPKRVERILRNLLANAIEHGERKPINIWVKKGKTAVAVAVRDYGVGIEPEDLDRVFDRFWRADSSRQRTLGGTGLGLSIAMEDTTLHNGWLQVWSRAGKGTCFRLTLPLAPGKVIEKSPVGLPPSEKAADAEVKS